jgi:hypothetical protein
MHQKDHRTCPRTKFREDLIHLLKKWRAAGDRIVVCLDANEDIYRKAIGKALTEEGGLDMKEVVGAYTGKRIGPTFFRGQLPIDGVWATPDITVSNACIMPAGYGIGDHRLFVIDMHTSSLIGTGPPATKSTPGLVQETEYSSPPSGKEVRSKLGEKFNSPSFDRKAREGTYPRPQQE